MITLPNDIWKKHMLYNGHPTTFIIKPFIDCSVGKILKKAIKYNSKSDGDNAYDFMVFVKRYQSLYHVIWIGG